MALVDLTIEICGMSGNGTIAAGGLLNQALSGAGFFLLAFDSYPAEIPGASAGVSPIPRVGDEQMLALKTRIDVLISLDDSQSLVRAPFLAENAVVLFDNNPPSYVSEEHAIAAHVRSDVNLFGIPFSELSTLASGNHTGTKPRCTGRFCRPFSAFRPSLFMRSSRRSSGPKEMKSSAPTSRASTSAVNMFWRIFNRI